MRRSPLAPSSFALLALSLATPALADVLVTGQPYATHPSTGRPLAVKTCAAVCVSGRVLGVGSSRRT